MLSWLLPVRSEVIRLFNGERSRVSQLLALCLIGEFGGRSPKYILGRHKTGKFVIWSLPNKITRLHARVFFLENHVTVDHMELERRKVQIPKHSRVFEESLSNPAI